MYNEMHCAQLNFASSYLYHLRPVLGPLRGRRLISLLASALSCYSVSAGKMRSMIALYFLALTACVSALPTLQSRWSIPNWKSSSPHKSTFIDFIGKRGALAGLTAPFCDLSHAILPQGKHQWYFDDGLQMLTHSSTKATPGARLQTCFVTCRGWSWHSELHVRLEQFDRCASRCRRGGFAIQRQLHRCFNAVVIISHPSDRLGLTDPVLRRSGQSDQHRS